MKHPEKWRETIDPFSLPYNHFTLNEVFGYPHAGNDVFQANGIYNNQKVAVFIKAARQRGADLKREIETISQLGWSILPQIIDYDEEQALFVVTLAKDGERLSTILGDNANHESWDYLYEYGQTLARLHQTVGEFPDVKDRIYFHIPAQEYLERKGLRFVYDFLITHQPKDVHRCFCHGDFHYANILWKEKHISAILDFELSGMGNREFDMAWALIQRPGQRFLNTSEEIEQFLDGYRSVASFSMNHLKYYMVLIYSRFYDYGKHCDGYQNYVMDILCSLCQSINQDPGTSESTVLSHSG